MRRRGAERLRPFPPHVAERSIAPERVGEPDEQIAAGRDIGIEVDDRGTAIEDIVHAEGQRHALGQRRIDRRVAHGVSLMTGRIGSAPILHVLHRLEVEIHDRHEVFVSLGPHVADRRVDADTALAHVEAVVDLKHV